MLGDWLKRCYLMCNEMHGHSAAKCYHCLSRRFLRTSKNWKQKSSERHDPQQINLMQGHWLKRYQLKWNEMHRQSAAKNHHCLSNRFLRTPQNWKQKSSETRSTKNSIWCSHIEPRNLNRKKTEFTHSQLKHYHWFSERLLCKPRNWKHKSQGWLKLRNISLMRDIDWNDANLCEMKCRDTQLQNVVTVCQRDSCAHHIKKWTKKSSERHIPEKSNLMQGHWLKRYKLKRNQKHTVSCHMSTSFVKDINT